MKHISEKQKIIISILTGVISVVFAGHYITMDAAYELYFAPSMLVPMVIGYLFGGKYAAICSVFGLSMFQPFLIYTRHGWTNFICCIGILIGSCGIGFFQSEIRKGKEPFFTQHLFQIVFAIGYVFVSSMFTPILAQNNKFFPVYAYSFFPSILTGIDSFFFVEVTVICMELLDTIMLFSFVRNWVSGQKKEYDRTMNFAIGIVLAVALLLLIIMGNNGSISNSIFSISIAVNTYQNNVGIIQTILLYEFLVIIGGNVILHMIFNYLESQSQKEEMAKMQQAIFDASNDIIMGINGMNGKVIIANHSADKFLEGKNNNYRYTKFLDIFDADNIDFWIDSLDKANESHMYRTEYFNNDTKRYYDMQIYRIDLEYQENDFAIFAKDITDEVSLSEQLEEINDELENRVLERTKEIQKVNGEKEQVGYMIAHELKAPLRAIGMYNAIVEKEMKDTADQETADAIEKIKQYCEKSLCLIQEMLAYSKEKTKKFKLTRIKMNPFVDNIVNEMRVLYSKQKIEVTRDDLPEILADEMLMHSCIQNILSNAVKYSSKEEISKIFITYENRESDYLFHIQDNGIGFSMQESGELFQLFGRMHASDEYEGNGVGLVMVKNTIERHGGQLFVEAEEGKGCKVSFSIPK